MEFFIQMVLITAVSGVGGYACLQAGEKYPFIGIIGAFSLIGATGGLFWVGFMAAAYVWFHVSEATFGLLGILAGAPFILGPAYLIWLFASGGRRDYDGRGFDDGDGSN
jgi:hypothetical protein